LHDLRVAVRRTRSVLSQGKKVLPPAIVEPTGERFAWLGTLTSPARDLDVYLIEWDSYTGPLGAGVIAALEPVRDILEQRHRAAHSALAQALQSAEVAEMMITWGTWLHDPSSDDPQGVDAGRPLGKVVARRIARAQANLVEHGRLIRPDTPAKQVHDLRKDAKKLRYLVECFGSLLPRAPRKAFVRRLKAVQDNLGEHQDAEVHVAQLRVISGELHQFGAPPATMLAIGQLIERLEQRRIAARAEFAGRFAEYDTTSPQRALDAALEGMVQ
ncbi:MAG: CHAD domain-containing protein, partial [Actinomycetota bacterium]|nr:CHAD domain-containing protein [Actinomycetota bacterium]